ncbi:MAG: dephospho-CoA kinase [Curvibacter sp. GWA2_64_110]|nr:MAG: dephospho-CoA kinase [Curvibacter sp. GWA2_64_110]HCY15809.1 dephospho-CoA kinase [Curvibacter sp.]
MQAVIRLGLTGGIGSGKSTVAAMLARHGAAVIDADAISRQTTAAGGTAIAAIRQVFGPEFITSDGALDRDRMRERVFRDPGARRQLEHIIHPLVGLETARQTQAAIAAGRRCLVFDVPLLVESGHWRPRLDQVLVVDCRPEVQVERTMQRSGLARDAVMDILANQASREARLRAADIVLCNDGLSLQELALEVQQMAGRFGL